MNNKLDGKLNIWQFASEMMPKRLILTKFWDQTENYHVLLDKKKVISFSVLLHYNCCQMACAEPGYGHVPDKCPQEKEREKK